MHIYEAFEQRKPVGRGEEWIANVQFIGRVNADCTNDAISEARKRLKIRWPIVEKVVEPDIWDAPYGR